MQDARWRQYLPFAAVAGVLVLIVAFAFAASRTNDVDVDGDPEAEAAELEDTTDDGDGGLLNFIFDGGTEDVTVPSGTALALAFDQALSSRTAQVGQTFAARVAEPVSVDGRVVIPAGSTVSGEVVQAERSQRIGGRAKLGLAFHRLTFPSGEDVPISASYYTVAKSQMKKDAATIGGATAGGALLGRIIGHDKGEEAEGTAIGAVVGGAVGTGIAASNRGQEAAVGGTITVELDAPVTVEVDEA